MLSKVEENNSLIKSLKEKYGTWGYLELEEKIRRGWGKRWVRLVA